MAPTRELVVEEARRTTAAAATTPRAQGTIINVYILHTPLGCFTCSERLKKK